MANALCRRIFSNVETVHRNVWPAWVIGVRHLFSMLNEEIPDVDGAG